MLTIEVEIKGTSPLLQHRFSDNAEQSGATRQVMVDRGTPREQAEAVAYRRPDGSFYFPGTWVLGAMKNAAGNHKMRGSRKSAKYVVPAAVRITDIDITVLNGDGKSAKDFEVDSRPVTIPATKGRIMRHRPRFDVWSARFTLTINDSLLPEEFVQKVLTESGDQVGIGDFRPEKTGPFGCYRVTSWAKK